MPAVLASSVVVVSADRAHRMQRSTSTEALGRGLESILADDEETPEEEEEAEAKLEMTAAAGIFCEYVKVVEGGSSLGGQVQGRLDAENVDPKQASVGYLYVRVVLRAGGGGVA
ncbi:hypothetical protein GGI43DRAFT_383822 [Trichoderma evansii]